MRRYWDLLVDWMDEPTGLKITSVEVTRWNAISLLVTFAASAVYAYWVGSWRLFLILVGGYVLGGLIAFMRREQRGDG